MLTITAKEITLNNLGNLNIKGESDLYDNTGNKIGIVKIEFPNCKVEDDSIVVMGSNGVKLDEGYFEIAKKRIESVQ